MEPDSASGKVGHQWAWALRMGNSQLQFGQFAVQYNSVIATDQGAVEPRAKGRLVKPVNRHVLYAKLPALEFDVAMVLTCNCNPLQSSVTAHRKQEKKKQQPCSSTASRCLSHTWAFFVFVSVDRLTDYSAA